MTPTTIDHAGNAINVGDIVRRTQSAVVGTVVRINGDRVTVRYPHATSTGRADGLYKMAYITD